MQTRPGFSHVVIDRRDPTTPSPLGPAEARMQALVQADRLTLIGQLAGGLAHEMNTPLASISAHAEEAIEQLQDLPKGDGLRLRLEAHLHAVMRQARRCGRIASRMLQTSQTGCADTEDSDVHQVVRDVTQLLHSVAQQRGVSLSSDVAAELPSAAMSAAELEQLLHDLVQNAIDACHEGDFVRIGATQEGGWINLIVEDTGTGIPADVLPRVFDPFFTTKAAASGTGLGLSVCKAIVTRAHGSLDIASADGCGTIVKVALPSVESRQTEPAPVVEVQNVDRAARRSLSSWRGVLHKSFYRTSFIPSVALLAGLISLTGCQGSDDRAASRRPAAEAVGTLVPVSTTLVQDDPAAASKRATEASPQAIAELYKTQCAACHGDTGEGNGPAARFLYPKPRNFRSERFRLVTTENGIPTNDDLLHTIDRGMPGSAMFSFSHLSAANKAGLVRQVREFMAGGLTDALKREAVELGEEPNAEEIAAAVKERLEPGPVITMPTEWPAEDAQSVARGREIYLKAVCASCHGDTARGDGVQQQVDESGVPIRPRDYTLGIFKGGREREQLYARIAIGVPGTPMPSTPSLSQAETCDLVHYIRSLSDPITETQTVHARRTIKAVHAVNGVPEGPLDERWNAVESTPVVVSPLWWRDDPAPDLKVQATHDKETLAIRLNWADATCNDSASRSEEFEDMAAIQYLRSGPEPFFGMGSDQSIVDLWHWRAGAKKQEENKDSILDEYPWDSDAYRERYGKSNPRLPDFLTARGAGNVQANPAQSHGTSNLVARGLGTTTAAPPTSQYIKANAEWKDGRWYVEFRRPIDATQQGGDSLLRGNRHSIGFAIWQGDRNDRNGQKLVSIWQDLVVN